MIKNTVTDQNLTVKEKTAEAMDNQTTGRADR